MNSRFAGEAFINIEINGTVNFTNVLFENPNRVLFQKINFEQVALVKANVQDINFLDCTWPRIGNRIAVFDEIYYNNFNEIGNSKFLPKPTLGEIEQLYRRLQSNFEKNKCPNEAGDFYIGAMEMRRKQLAQDSRPVCKWLRQHIFSTLAWYRYISMYGERYVRTLLWMLFFVFLFFPTLYLVTGFEYPNTIPITPVTVYERIHQLNWSNIGKAIEVSVYAFSFQRKAPFLLTRCSHIISIIETIISAILLPLFLLALRRRFRR